MSWLFSQALVEEFSAGGFLAGEPSAPLSVMPTAHNFWRRGKTIESSNLSLFGLTCAVLTESHGATLLESYLADSRAKTLAPQGKALALVESAPGSGSKWLESSMKYDPVTRGWKTAQLSLLGDSVSFSGTWPAWGLMRNGECFGRPTLVSRIDEIESGSVLPTPSGVNGGRNHTMGRIDEWGGSSNPLRGTAIGSMCLPEFEELVMGWPIGWTELTPFETDKFREWQQQHGKS
ncbi:hypothetical protein D9M72_325830 [compost metagenome]